MHSGKFRESASRGAAHSRSASVVAVIAGAIATLVAGRSVAGFEVFVDANTGIDAHGRGHEVESPARTIGYALDVARESGESAIVVRIASGVYAGDALGGGEADDRRERWPLVVPHGVRELELIGPAPSADDDRASATLESYDPSTSFVRLVAPVIASAGGVDPLVDNAAGLERVRFERLRFVGGRVGVTVTSDAAARGDVAFDVVVRGCEFADIAGAAVQVFASARRALASVVDRCRVERCGGAIVLHAGRAARLDAIVVDCRFSDIDVSIDGQPLGGAIDCHADGEAIVAATIERNWLRNPQVAFAITTAPPDAGDATLDLLLRNNVVYRGVEPDAVSDALDLDSAFFLSVWPPHAVNVHAFNNTFWGLARHALYLANPSEFDRDGASPLRIALRNSIFAQPAESDALPDAPRATFSNLRDGRVPAGVVVSHAILPLDWDAGSDPRSVLRGDPGFVAPLAADFSLVAPSSPAIDSGEALGDDELGPLDALGACRVQRPSAAPIGSAFIVDRGAIESPGVCVADREAVFVRGHCNRDDRFDVADATEIFGFLFLGSTRPECVDACDTNDDGVLDITDGVSMLTYLFLGGPAPRPPFPDPGIDPSADTLEDCARRP